MSRPRVKHYWRAPEVLRILARGPLGAAVALVDATRPLRTAEIAQRLDVPERTVYGWCAQLERCQMVTTDCRSPALWRPTHRLRAIIGAVQVYPGNLERLP